MKHFLIVPFNAGSKDKEWLKHRMRFFTGFTEISILNQTNKQFTPVFLVDPSTSLDIKTHLRTLGLCYYTESKWAVQREKEEEIDSKFSQFLQCYYLPGEWVITSRVDNDDGLALDYIERTQKLFRKKEEFIIYPKGLMWVDGKLFEKITVSPPFGSLVELSKPWHIEPLKTVFYLSHGSAVKKDHQVYDKDYMWIHTYHGKNLATTPRKLGPEVKNPSRFKYV